MSALRGSWSMVRSVVLAWVLVLAGLLAIALQTTSLVAWAAAAIVAGMPALMLMVLEHAPVKTVAQIIRDAEAP